jgi:light-regulated signal transduction histidine kinase (bacteriophytochrome)
VLPPVWRQVWFIALLVVLGALIATQTVRVLVEKRRLQKAHDELEERVRQRTAQLEHANKELESFAYSVSHDLRAPLRSIDGFSRALLEDYHSKLDEEGRDDLQRVRAAAQRMGSLIDAMLTLSRVTRGALRFAPVNLSQIATEILEELARHDPENKVKVTIAPEVIAPGDTALLRNVMQNLLANAWKFTAKQPDAHIEFGVAERDGEKIYFVRDNGAGFNRADARNLFGAFQRFHSAAEFSGTGIGLATVQRIIHRHGGRVDAESKPGEGALFYFTLPPEMST